MILLVDNYDSFVYNLYQLIGSINTEIKVIRNDEINIEQIKKRNPSHIVLSPGPGKPSEAGICSEIVKAFQGEIPILGICLGHQVIAEVFESIVSYAKEVVHGKAFKLKIMENSPLFEGIDKEFMGARYHSLAIKRETLGEDLKIIATTDDGEIMAIEHRKYPIYGLQFHPESILSDNGKKLIQNFLDIRGGQNDKTSNGFRIRQLNQKDMKETIQIRCAIEGFCTHCLANDINTARGQKTIRELGNILDLQYKTIEDHPDNDNYEDFISYDHQFHLLLVKYINNDEVNHIFQRLMYLIKLTSQSALEVDGRITGTLDEHKKYFDYLKAGNGDKAYSILIDHLMMPLNVVKPEK